MNISLIVPLCSDKAEYEYNIPYLFNFSSEGVSLCVKSIQGLDLNRFDYIYFTILEKLDTKYCLSELLHLQFKKLGLSKAKIVVLENPTSSQAETVYQTVKRENITGCIFIKDADGYFTGDFTLCNSVAVFPLDRLEMVNPGNKSYVELDDQFYITNIIEKRIISRYFNAGAYIFEEADVFGKYFERLSHYKNLFMSHIVYSMLLDKISFRPFDVKEYQDWGSQKTYRYSLENQL